MTSFAKRVYRILLNIPLGQVHSYKWVAKKAGRPKAWRAVGQILKHNPWPLIIPCHRVVGFGGEPGGYIFGKRMKKRLLNLERQIKELVL
ncbi:MAG: MGMT family protein [Candidatus Omnitrophica bacterium]|nr:MGMT family protein [Candidatus Omnitrophota bacterium]